MKKLFLSIALLVFITIQIKGQGNLPGGFQHIIEVGRYSDYGKGYLTIMDANCLFIKNGEIDTEYHYTYEYDTEFKQNYKMQLRNGDLILEVDGVSAYNWTPEDFYQKVEGRHDYISLKIRTKNDTCIYEFNTRIRQLYELPDDVSVFNNAFATVIGKTQTQKRKDRISYVNKTTTTGFDMTFEVRNDEDFDFFPCLFYDYLITSNDPLLDKEILKSIRLGTRNEQSPDLLFTIAKDAGEKISTTYIPPTSRTVNEGSTTKVQYNYILHKNEYITKQKNRTITEGGYTQETRTADMFLEIAALDVKKLDDPKSTFPPIVWQATVKRHLTNYNFNLNDEMKDCATWMYLPINDRYVYTGEQTIYAPVGILTSNDNPTVIQTIIPGSRAEKIGLMPGDKLIKVDMPNADKYEKKIVKEGQKKNGWVVLSFYLDNTYTISILRNGEKLKFNLEPNSLVVSRSYYERVQ